MQQRTRRRAAAAAAVLTVSALTLAACGSSEEAGQGEVLNWYINPDGGGTDPAGGGQAQLAKECTDASDGKYTIRVQVLPNSASDQRQQLLRRLAASDSSVDIMSIDPVFVAEFAEAGFLAKVPEQYAEEFVSDAVDPIVSSAMWKDEIYAAPFWANTQLLWYRKSMADKAGLDMSKPVTWDQLIEAAKKDNKYISVQASRYEGYMVWINALIEGGGGSIVENPGADGADLKFGLNSEAGTKAAEIIAKVSKEGVGGPAMSSTDETTSLDMFQNEQSAFMVNWPYVYAAMKGADVEWIDDVAWVRYPRTVEDQESRPPLGGIEMGVNESSTKKDAAWEAVSCLTSEQSQVTYMVGTGNPAARKKAYDDKKVRDAFPMAPLIRDSLDGGAPRPLTQYYGDVSSGIQREYSPPSGVNPSSTPKQTTTLLQDVLKGDALL